MWHRTLVRCTPVLRPSLLFQSHSSQALRQACTAKSTAYMLRPTCTSFAHAHGHRFTTQRDDSIAPVSQATAAITTPNFSTTPGVESSGDKFVMVYTCSVCETRSAKTISKHAYYKGVVLVRCPGCENLHLIADRLGWFEDDAMDVESLLKQKGEKVRFVTEKNVLELTENDVLGIKSKD